MHLILPIPIKNNDFLYILLSKVCQRIFQAGQVIKSKLYQFSNKRLSEHFHWRALTFIKSRKTLVLCFITLFLPLNMCVLYTLNLVWIWLVITIIKALPPKFWNYPIPAKNGRTFLFDDKLPVPCSLGNRYLWDSCMG